MSVPKNRRRKSSADFEMIYFRLVDGVDELIAHDFFAEGGLAERNRTFLNIRCESLQRFTDDLLYYIQIANSIYPQCEAELNERRLAQDKAAGLRLSVNYKKTHIVKLSHSFIWLQTKYVITGTGGIKTIPTRSKLLRERRRLKAFRRLVEKGGMTTYDAWMAYRSWRGSVMTDYNSCFQAIRKMDALFWRLFPVVTHIRPENRHMVADGIWRSAEPADLRNYCLTN